VTPARNNLAIITADVCQVRDAEQFERYRVPSSRKIDRLPNVVSVKRQTGLR